MVAGHIIIICLISLIFIFGQLNPVAGWGASPAPLDWLYRVYLHSQILVANVIFDAGSIRGQAFEGEHHDDAHALY